MNSLRLTILAVVTLAAAPLGAQSEGLRSVQVGERFDGYMGFATPPSDSLRRQVQAINIQRRNLYTELAVRRDVTTDLVGRATACQLFSQLSPGEPYLLDDGVWRRYVSGQPVPVPAQCR